jgi:hypothetical protein
MTTTSRTIALVLALFAGCTIDDIEHGDADDDFPQRMAQAYCAGLFACDPSTLCASDVPELAQPYSSEAECVEREQELLEEVRASAHTAGLTYDPDCVDRTIAWYEEADCSTAERLRVLGAGPLEVCPPYYGTIPEGENPCFEVVGSALSDCGSGLQCEEEVCIGNDGTCECEAGFACNYEIHYSDICLPILPLGAECDAAEDSIANPTGVCEADAYCEPKGWDEDAMLYLGVCAPRKPLGTECAGYDHECSSFACLGTCVPGMPAICDSWMAPRRWR